MPGIIPPGAPIPVGTAPPKKPAQHQLHSGGNAVSILTHGKGGQPVKMPGGETLTLNVRGLQQQLRKDGYDVKVDGKVGPQTLSALRDYYKPTANLSPALAKTLQGGPLTGKRNPTAWNKRFGTATTKSPAFRKAAAVPGGSLDAGGNDVTSQYAPPSQDVNLSPQQKVADMLAKQAPISEKLAAFGQLLDPKTADAMAGQQFDPQIHDTQLAIAKDPLQAATNAKDVGSWYGQALAALATAGTRDAAAGHAAQGSIDNAGQALVASLGGGANMGAGDVAAAGQNASGTIAAENLAQDQYNSDLAPIFQQERAGQLTNQSHIDAAKAQADQHTLEDLQGQRGQALTTAQGQIRSENNSLEAQRASFLEGIKKDNNAMAQQGFQNSLALAQAQIAAMMSGLQVQNAQAAANKNANPGTFALASPSTKNSAAAAAWAALHDPQGNLMQLTPQQAKATISRVYSTYGWNPATPQVGQAIGNVFNQFASQPR